MAAEEKSFIVRSAESVEEVSALWWPLMKELGWNRDSDDALTHYHAARDGNDWLMLVPKQSEKPEGCVVAFTYPNSTGWVGYFIVNAEYRGNGLGRELWKELEATFKASNTAIIGLDGVQEQVNTYQRRGFEDVGRIRLMTRPSLKQKPITPEQSQAVSVTGELVDVKSVDPKILAKIDLEHTGLDRSLYWSHKALLSRKDAFGYALTSPGNASEIRGYVLVRRCEHGHRFGPLYAETYEEALRLLYVAMNRLTESGGSMIAEIFGSNPQGESVFTALGWEWANVDYHRMWLHGKVPKEQQEGGKGTKGMFAIFDACAG